jgi:hypothetical protein
MTSLGKCHDNHTAQPALHRGGTRAFHGKASVLFTLCALFLCMAVPAPAEDRVIVIPAPPPPDRVLNKVGSFFHRLFNGDKNSSTRRSRSHDQDRDEDDADTASPRSASSAKTGSALSRSNDPDASGVTVEEGTTRGTKHRSTPQSTVASSRTSRPDSDRRDSSSEPPKTSASQRSSASHKEDKEEDPASTAQTSEPAANTDPSPSPSNTSTASTQPALPAAEPPVAFARPVPGKPGFVYPPGAPESLDNIVDVLGFKPGQIVRDPRTKALFRVP